MSNENKAIARRFFEEVVSEGKVDVIDDICAPNYRLHATLSGADAIDRDQLKDLVGSWRFSSVMAESGSKTSWPRGTSWPLACARPERTRVSSTVSSHPARKSATGQ
jgi:hypothetical protein